MTDRVGRSPLTLLGALLALYLLVPIGYFVYRFAGSSDRGFDDPGLTGALVTSAETASISTLLIAVLGIPLAYWLARSPGRLARLVGLLVGVPLALPPVMSGILLIYVVGPYTPIGTFFDYGLTDTLTGVVLAQTFVASPFLVIVARSGFSQVEPSLYDLAATLGHRPSAVFFRVAVPAAAGAIQAGLLLTWLRALGEYGATVLLAYHPYTLPVFTELQFSSTGLAGTQAPTAYALALAVVAVGLSTVRLPARRGRGATRSEPKAPARAVPTPVSFDLDVRVGTFHLRVAHTSSSPRLAILGPSGSGKTVTLRALAGLYGSGAGSVSLGDTRVDDLPPARRHVGLVPQSHGLIPNRTVWRQVMFGVGSSPGLASWWLATLGLDGLAGRLPRELSGGQAQRVSLAQALARAPRVVLLDEPFSALDTPVRARLRAEFRRLQRETGLSTVLVTHDPEEAALLADEVLVVDGGRLLQAGTRAEVFGRPASVRVARLLGIDNVAAGTVDSAGRIRTGTVDLAANEATAPGPVLWSVRPERVVVGEAAFDRHAAVVDDVADLGTGLLLTVTLEGGPTLGARAVSGIAPVIRAGQRCGVAIDPADVLVWPATADGPGDDGAEPARRGGRD